MQQKERAKTTFFFKEKKEKKKSSAYFQLPAAQLLKRKIASPTGAILQT